MLKRIFSKKNMLTFHFAWYIMRSIKAVTERKISSLSMSGRNAGVQRYCGWCKQVLTDM